MKAKDKQNLLRAWPIYVMFVLMMIGIIILYKKNPRPREPLGQSISKHFNKKNLPLDTLDNILNARTTWEPVLPEAIGLEVGDFDFIDLNNINHNLSDFSGNEILVVFWASWSPACKMMRPVLQELTRENNNLTIIALSSESQERIREFTDQFPLSCFIARQDKALPNPFSQIEDIPAYFFIRPDRHLKLAAVGFVPFEHANAIIQLKEESLHGSQQ